MEEMIQTAADQGLTGICFTEHFDPDYPDTPENLDFSLNIPAYRQKLENLADAFKDQIPVSYTHLDVYKRQSFMSPSITGVFASYTAFPSCLSLSPYPSRIIKTVGFLLIIFPFLSLIENLSGTALH